MAEQVSQIKVEIDTEEAQAKLNQLYETQAKLVGEMSKVEEGSEAYKGLGDSLGETNKQIGSIESNIGKQKMGLNELDDITNAASISVTNLGLAETTLGKVINSAADVVGKIKTATNAYTKAQQAANVAVNSGTKATKGLNMAMKGNILISVITMALPLILSLVDKLKEAGKETLTLADRLDMINARYERLQNVLSKLGVSEIVALSVEQRRLKDEIDATNREYDKMRFEGEKVTEKMLKDLELQEGKYKDIQQQIKYLNEDQARTNKLLKEQADLDKRISQNTNALSTAKARLEIEKERNGYSDKYFDILENTERLEEEGYRLQEESLKNKEKAIDDEFAASKKRINETEKMSDEEKEKEIAIRAQTVELEKQAIANQKSTIAYERQLSALIKQKALISEMKQLEETNLRLTIQMNESSTRVYASNVRNLDDMNALYNNQNDQMALFRKGMVEWEATMKKTTGIKTFEKDAVDEFFKEWNKLQESDKKVLEELKQKPVNTKWTDAETAVYDKYKQWSELAAQYASGMNQLVTDLGANMATTAEAQMKAMGAMFQFYVAGSEDVTWDQYVKFLKDITGLKALYKKLEDDNKGEKSDAATNAGFAEFLNPRGGNDPDERKGALDFYETLQKGGAPALELLKNYITTLNDGRIEVYKQIEDYNIESNRVTVDYFARAMMVGLASYKEYVGAYDNLLSTQEEMAKTDVDLQADTMKKAGVDEIKIKEWVKNEKLRIDKDYEVNRKQLHQQVNLEILSQGVEFVNNMSSIFADLYDGNKDVQKATIVVSTFANAAMAFGSTFAQSPGGFAAKAVQAAAASAAVLASGIKAYRQVDSANKGTTLSGGGSSAAPQTGTSAVSSTIIERQIRPVRTTSSTETVLVLSDVEAKQRQQQNVNKVSVI